jgi:hypothetical protein
MGKSGADNDPENRKTVAVSAKIVRRENTPTVNAQRTASPIRNRRCPGLSAMSVAMARVLWNAKE